MTSQEFWDSTPKEFHYRQKGYFKKVERKNRSEWERVRWQTTFLLAPHTGKKKLQPRDLAVFAWEEEILEIENKVDPIAMKKMADSMDRHAAQPNETNK